MSSKSNPNLRDARRRQPPGRGKALTRSTSLLGSIGRFVAAPINWLIRPDSVEFEDDTDPAGKRRRTVAPAAGQAVERGDGPAPNKRMRVRSPDRQQEPHHSGVVNAYLDPPDVVFRRQSHHNDTLNTSSNHFNHSAPAIQNIVPEFNFNFGRNTTSPMRHPITRTMSTDPPQALQSRTAARDISRKWVPRLNTVDQDVIMEAASQPSLSDTRDLSMPPLSARPSFRMRTSMTPQPIRDASEPPSLSSLREKPVFVRPPVQEPHRKSSIQPVTTLGKLVDSHRSTHSPVRQHSSLVFSQPLHEKKDPRHQNAAERALQELEIYKTPLLPTRLRGKNQSNITGASSSATDITNLFRPRNRLILMQDDRRKGKGKDKKEVNQTKPYAGEGGMKKLLARRKLEEQYEKEQDEGLKTSIKEHRSEDRMQDEDAEERQAASEKQSPPAIANVPLPPPPEKDSFSLATASDRASSSSLRVGRAPRNHINRPTSRPSRPKFSAAFEDDDDNMDDQESRKEMELLAEAAKNVPVFQIPAGFSFKDTKPIEHNAANAKEPPISSLPFSLGRPSFSTAQSHPEPAQQQVHTPPAAEPPKQIPSFFPSVAPSAPELPTARSPSPVAPAPSRAPPPPSNFFAAAPDPPRPSPPVTGSEGAVPNFFANSKVLKEQPPPILATPPLSFGAPPVSASLSSDPAPTLAPAHRIEAPSPFTFGAAPSVAATPVKDADNPFWEGEKNDDSQAKQGLFGSFGSNKQGSESTGSAVQSSSSFNPEASGSVSMFGAPKADAPTSAFGNSFKPAQTTAPSSLPFTFGKPAEPSASNPFAPAAAKIDSETTVTAAPMFGSSAVGSTSTAAPMLFGGASDAPKSAPTTTSFSFGQPASAAAEGPKSLFGSSTESNAKPFGSAIEAPKPMFGSGGGGAFSFGQPNPSPEKEAPKTASPFSFGAQPSTPPIGESKRPSPFTFGSSSSNAAVSAPASVPSFFGGGNATSSVRPVTPPRNEDQEFRMEESPTRDLQANTTNKLAEPRPTLGGFSSFNSTSSLFGQPTGGNSAVSASSPFAFGSTPSPTMFGSAINKPEEPKAFGGFGQTSAQPSGGSSFSFGRAKAPENDPPRPSTTGSFSFQSPTSATGPGPSFTFGAPSNNNVGNPFGQVQTGSAPSSPLAFNQPSSFGFGQAPSAPAPSSNPFAFGSSQPASPATPSTGLPQMGGFGSGTGGFGTQPQPTPSFGAPQISAQAPSSGGNLFTIGAAPPMAPPAANRAVKKLPMRRKR